MEAIVKVTSTKTIGILLISFSIFPVVFFLLLIPFEGNYLLTSGITITLYIILTIFLIKKIKKKEEKYIIIADKNGLTILNKGNYLWGEISKIATFSYRDILMNRTMRYIRFIFNNGTVISVKANNFDIDYEELKIKLENFKNNCDKI